MIRVFLILTVSVLVSCASISTTLAAEPKYKADVPASVMTADSVNTKYAGELTFVDGFPTDETIAKADDFKDTARAFELFGSGMATESPRVFRRLVCVSQAAIA
jgi:hypothetical protein